MIKDEEFRDMQERVQCEIVEYTFSSCYNSALEFAEKTVCTIPSLTLFTFCLGSEQNIRV